MERHFHEELEKLNKNLLRMAALTEKAIYDSVDALRTRNKDLALAVIEGDKEIDELENIVEEEAIELLALFQPMAKDLRLITTAMRISVDIERIADLTVNICQRVLQIADAPLLKSLIDTPKLADNAKMMVKNAIDAFVNKDEELAKQVILSDKESNRLRTVIVDKLINEYIIKDGTTAPRAVALLLVARDLERISDHATNIAEDVIYMIKAKVVKHHLDELIFVYRKVRDDNKKSE